ncbi:hypothetical protein BAUCODRAFT_50372, partial [Baudoinia panamericana UAMH 10762]
SLLEWVHSFNHIHENIRWADLSDGKELWTILQDIDGNYFRGSLPEPEVGPQGDWLRKWQNLKHVDRQISTYYRDVCNGQDGIAHGHVPDLKAVAAESSVRDLERLIMIVIRASMAGPASNQAMAQRLMGLGREKAMVIAQALRNMEEPAYADSEPTSRDASEYQSEPESVGQHKANGTKEGGVTYEDPLLEREEQLLQAQSTIEKLQASHVAAQRQLEQLRQDRERLQESFDAYRAEIDSKGGKHGGDDEFRKLQRQAESDRAYIDELEGHMQSSRSTVESYERQIDRFKAEYEVTQKLRDDIQMLQADNEELHQKLRANENLKKKIQSLQEQEKANVALREELRAANDRLSELERLKQVQAGLEKEIIEKKGLIRNQEYQITELTTTRKHAEYDAKVLAQKLAAARERHDRDHEALEELRLKMQEMKA